MNELSSSDAIGKKGFLTYGVKLCGFLKVVEICGLIKIAKH